MELPYSRACDDEDVPIFIGMAQESIVASMKVADNGWENKNPLSLDFGA